MKENRIIVAGGRDFNDYSLLDRKLNHILQRLAPDNTAIVSGMARGADKLGVRWARKNNFDVIPFPADWNTYGKKAGFLRNAQMANMATHLIAFWDGKSSGTANMIELATNKGLKVVIIDY